MLKMVTCDIDSAPLYREDVYIERLHKDMRVLLS